MPGQHCYTEEGRAMQRARGPHLPFKLPENKTPSQEASQTDPLRGGRMRQVCQERTELMEGDHLSQSRFLELGRTSHTLQPDSSQGPQVPSTSVCHAPTKLTRNLSSLSKPDCSEPSQSSQLVSTMSFRWCHQPATLSSHPHS